ncbi:response regulator transcription factor [Marinicrinis lubricantis]|uniref:Response regulator n=1 Tax=Marinicrinis lubricantis TaxID=2086470 RepID=A0ABW1IRE5_9BACL
MVKVLLVDDDSFIRESLKMIFDLQPDLEVVGTCGNGQEALQFVRQQPLDVVVMDIRMPICDGVEGTKRIKSEFPNVKILILTTFDDDEYIAQAVKYGAEGYMLKNVSPAEIMEGIQTVAKGNMLVHPQIARKLSQMVQTTRSGVKKSLADFQLTSTEAAIVEKIADGLSNKEIASALFLSEGTVKNYVTEILSKLELRDRTQIAIFYLKQIDAS